MSNNPNNNSKKLEIKKQTPWFSTSELLEYLGITSEDLDLQLKYLTKNIHYRYEKDGDPQSQVLWRVDLIDELLCLPIPPLEREAMLKAINNHITCNE